MRVLWLCNIMLPMIAESLGLSGSNKEGWLSGLAAKICEQQETEIELAVCFPTGKEPMRGSVALQGQKKLLYYGFVENTAYPERYDTAVEEQLREVLADFAPDVVHCFGTEYPHTLAMTRAFDRPQRTLIGIQGLCSVYADSYMADLPENIQNRVLLRDFLKRDDLRRQQKKYRQRGEYEKEAIERTAHVTGRTDWDKKWTGVFHPAAKYHFMNETLRTPFYGSQWQLSACQKHSIFLSQGNYPIKGLHYMLQAMPEILKRYPDTQVFVAGDEITRFSTIKEKLKISNYGKYLLELIRQNHLENAVTFCGRLDAQEMLARFLKSHVFVSPSAIENSPNSVGEAMLLGMPVVSSDVGGVHNMLKDGIEGFLYEAADIKALAGHICYIFDEKNQEQVQAMGQRARTHARLTHDPETNYRRLMEIYHEINLCV